MEENAKQLLSAWGVTVPEEDPVLPQLCRAVEAELEALLHRRELPEILSHLVLFRVVGRYLSMQKNSGQLAEAFDLEAAVKQIQEGDTSVTFSLGEGSLTAEQRLDLLCESLCDWGRELLSAFRKVDWT